MMLTKGDIALWGHRALDRRLHVRIWMLLFEYLRECHEYFRSVLPETL